MTQEIFCAHADGAVLLSDSLLIHEDEAGARRRLSQRKLFALGHRAAIVSGGAAIGIDLSRALAAAVAERQSDDVADIIAFAPAFLNAGYAAFLERARHWFAAHPDAYQRLYILIAGCPAGGPPAQTLLLGSESIDTPLTSLPIRAVLTMPRRLMLEIQLAKLAQTATLPELADHCLRQMALLAEKDSATVAGPFDGVILSAQGLRPLMANGGVSHCGTRASGLA
jgi:hypothetical protein